MQKSVAGSSIVECPNRRNHLNNATIGWTSDMSEERFGSIQDNAVTGMMDSRSGGGFWVFRCGV